MNWEGATRQSTTCPQADLTLTSGKRSYITAAPTRPAAEPLPVSWEARALRAVGEVLGTWQDQTPEELKLRECKAARQLSKNPGRACANLPS